MMVSQNVVMILLVSIMIDKIFCRQRISKQTNLQIQSLYLTEDLHKLQQQSQINQISQKIPSIIIQTGNRQSCKQNFILNPQTNKCICPQQNDFIYVSSTDQCKCFLGQVRINERGVKICQKTQEINIGLFCVGLIIDFFIIWGIYKCCCGKNNNQSTYNRQQDDNRCQRRFIRCLCMCLFNHNKSHHHNHDHNNHHHHGHHHNKHHHGHHHHKKHSLLTQQS